MCGSYSAWQECRQCPAYFGTASVVYFCDSCAQLAHGEATDRNKHSVTEVPGIPQLDLLSVICVKDDHYVCFMMSEDRWVLFDSMANEVSK